MTKLNFLTIALLAMCVPMVSLAQTPKMMAFPDPNTTSTSPRHNFYLNYVGSRALVTNPSSLEGALEHTIANDGSGGANEWGGDIGGSPINDVDIVKAAPFEACGALTNGSAINGKIALIMRGNCEFGVKALNAQQAGAIAVIIVNNVPNGPAVEMGAGAQGGNVTIPVIMVSNADGNALANATNPKMSMREWSNGGTNDIGFVDKGLSLFNSYCIPLNQLSGSSSHVLKGFDGAVIANYGTATANTVKLKVTVSWTAGTPGNITGTPTVVHADSMTISTAFAPADSIITPMLDNAYSLNPTGTGRYDVTYELIPDFTDDFPENNTASYSFYVDNRVYSKSRYDFANNAPLSAYGTTFADNSLTLCTGPMYYMEKGDYAIERVSFRAFNPGDDTASSMAGKGSVDMAIFEWDDQNGDSIMVSGECSLVGFGTYTFKSGDTDGQSHFVDISDPLDASKKTVTKANTWYWATVSAPASSIWIGFDGTLNYFPRSWGRIKSSSPIREMYSPVYSGGYDGWQSAQNDAAAPYPFDLAALNFAGDLEDSVRFSVQKRGTVASVSLQMSLFKVDVEDLDKSSQYDITMYPNPASDVLNINLNLDEQAKEVRYGVFTMFGGKTMDDVIHNNVTNDTYSISTANLAAGTYYVSISVDGVSEVRKFTVVK